MVNKASPNLPHFAAIIVAAGKGLRAGQKLPKQFAIWKGKPVLRHSVEALATAGAKPIIIAIPETGEDATRSATDGIENVEFIIGGNTRQQSVRNALEKLAQHAPEYVLIHDAARPHLPRSVIERLLAALRKDAGAIPALPVIDSLAVEDGGLMVGTAPRDQLRRVQTPQAFRFADILSAHRNWQGEPNAGDDAQVLRAMGGSVALVDGDERLKKLTFAEDFVEDRPALRIGTGYDVHRLQQGEELWLCGVQIDHEMGLAGHSDADVALHAVVDALLGAAGAGDIGQHFPPSDNRWKGAPSSHFVEHAVSLVAKAGYRVGNIDLTIICEAPKIGPHRNNMVQNLAQLAQVETGQVNIKATTTERLGFTGREEGIAAQAAATIIRNN